MKTDKQLVGELKSQNESFRNEYKDRLRAYLALNPTDAHDEAQETAFRALCDCASAYFASAERLAEDSRLLVEDDGWVRDLAESSYTTLQTLVKHYRMLRTVRVRLKVDTIETARTIRPSDLAYAAMQRLVDRHLGDLAITLRDLFVAENLPTHGFDNPELSSKHKKGTPQEIVISLHGIRTTGAWQKEITEHLIDHNITYIPLDYGWFRAAQLLVPFLRDQQIDWFRDQYTQICERRRGQPISIIAHSFGSYIITSAILKYPQLKFNKVILCGSIVDESYAWSEVIARGQVERVLHDFGSLDRWAKVAVYFIADAGQSGRYGFRDQGNGKLIERNNQLFGHSDFFYTLNYRETWIPFLKGADPGPPPLRLTKSRNTRFLVVKILVICAFVAASAIALNRWLPDTVDAILGLLKTAAQWIWSPFV